MPLLEVLKLLTIDTKAISELLNKIIATLERLSSLLLSTANRMESSTSTEGMLEQLRDQYQELSTLDLNEVRLQSPLGLITQWDALSKNIDLVREEFSSKRHQMDKIKSDVWRTEAKRIDGLLVDIGRWRSEVFRTQFRRSFWFTGVLVIGAILGGMATLYFRSVEGVEFQALDIISPCSAYFQIKPMTYQIQEQAKTHFLEAFNQEFFLKIGSHVLDDFKTTDLELSFRNKSSKQSFLVRTVEVSMDDFIPEKFPWKQLNYTPELKASLAQEHVLISSTGLAPATQVDATVHVGDWVFNQQAAFLEHGEEITLAGWESLTVQGNEINPVGYYLEAGTPMNPSRNYSTYQNRTIEVVKTLSRLQELTQVVTTSKIQLEIKYASLTGKTLTLNQEIDLGSPQLFFKTSGGADTGLFLLSSSHPVKMKYPQVSSAMISKTLAQAINLTNPDPLTEGESLIVVEAKLDGSRKGDDFSKAVNQLIKPDGFLIVRLKVSDLRNGYYHFSAKINGEDKDVIRFTMEGFQPEHEHFDANETEWLQAELKD